MKTLEEFHQFYQYKLKVRLADLDKKRLAIKNRLIGVIVFVLVGYITYIWVSEYLDYGWADFFDGDIGAAITFQLFGIAIVLIIYSWAVYYPYRNKFKSEITKEVLAFLGYPLIYNLTRKSPDRKTMLIEREILQMSDLFPLRSGVYLYFDDRVTGEIDGFKISFSEISITLPKEKHRDKKLPDRYNGVFLVAESPKEVKTDIRVTDKMFGSIVLDPRDFWVPDHEPVTDIDENSFMDRFLIYCKDDEWKEVLSKPLRVWLTNFRLQRRVQVAFKKNKIYATFTYDKDKDPLEPPLFKSINNFESVKCVLAHFLMVLSLADALRKNSL